MKCLGFKRSPSTAMIGMLKRNASLAGKSLALASWPKNLTIGPEFDALVNKHGNAHAAFEAVENCLQRGAIAGQIGGATGQPIPRESRVECRNADGREDGIQRAELACHGDHADVPVAEMAADKDGRSGLRQVLSAFDADHRAAAAPCVVAEMRGFGGDPSDVIVDLGQKSFDLGGRLVRKCRAQVPDEVPVLHEALADRAPKKAADIGCQRQGQGPGQAEHQACGCGNAEAGRPVAPPRSFRLLCS